jgi:serine protease AprX
VNGRAHVAELDNRSLAGVAADPRVKRVSLDRPVFATLERTGDAIGATAVREELGVTGKGIGVAVIDSGVAGWHDDLYRTRRLAHFKDFTNDTGFSLWTSTLPTDEYGHGTHVAGIIAGSGYLSYGRRSGVAPGAHIVGLKVLDGDGHGYISDVIAALDYAVSVKSTYNIRVINLSVASGVYESYRVDPLTLAAKRAVDAGIVVVAAAGNLGRDAGGRIQYGAITSPGNAPWVLTVGAASHQGTARRSDDSVGAFSSRGPTWIDFGAKPDLIAPGVGIESLATPWSTLSLSYASYLLSGARGIWYSPYLSLSGTSMAAPVVAGTVALMLEANPTLTPNAVKALLQFTAQEQPGEHVLAQGAGLVNARGAVRMARFFADPQLGIGPPSDSLAGEQVGWSQRILWGNYLVTGGTPLPGSNAWAANLPWGALKTAAGTPVVWGAQLDENIVWSTNADGNIVWSTSEDANIVWSTSDDGNIVWSTSGDANIVWSTDDDSNIVWSTNDDGNIVWSTEDDNNIVWSTALASNAVWGNDCGGRNCAWVIWGARSSTGLWGTAETDFNIVWSTAIDNNIVWSTSDDSNIVWSTGEDGNIVWSTSDDWNIVWSTSNDENIVWSTADDWNIVWSTSGDWNIVWSTNGDQNIVWSTSVDANIVWSTSDDSNIVWSTGAADQVLWPAAALTDALR